MENVELKLRQFDNSLPHDQLRLIYQELIEIKYNKSDLPPEVTEREYQVTEAARWVKKSASWIRKKIYDGAVPMRKNNKGKWVLSWDDIQQLLKIANDKYSK